MSNLFEKKIMFENYSKNVKNWVNYETVIKEIAFEKTSPTPLFHGAKIKNVRYLKIFNTEINVIKY